MTINTKMDKNAKRLLMTRGAVRHAKWNLGNLRAEEKAAATAWRKANTALMKIQHLRRKAEEKVALLTDQHEFYKLEVARTAKEVKGHKRLATATTSKSIDTAISDLTRLSAGSLISKAARKEQIVASAKKNREALRKHEGPSMRAEPKPSKRAKARERLSLEARAMGAGMPRKTPHDGFTGVTTITTPPTTGETSVASDSLSAESKLASALKEREGLDPKPLKN
jgi:hypothetical protein